MTLSWTDFKQFITSREDAIIMIETSSQYILIADNFRSIQCILDRDPSDTTDLDDFEANYESLCNQKPIAKEIIPTAPKNEFDLSIFDMGHKHIDSSAQIFDITLSVKSGVQYNYSCTQTPAYYDCLMQNHSQIRDGVADEESGVITTFYGNLAEGAATLAKPVDIDVPVKMLNNSDPFYYLWGVYVTAADYGEDDLVRLQVIDKDGIGVELGWYTQEQFEAMGSLYVIKEYDECWIGQLEKLTKVLTPDGSPGQLPNGVYLRAKYYPKDVTKTNIRFWFDPIISVKS